jgi:hypothetical protein
MVAAPAPAAGALKLLVYAALSYWCMRSKATSVRGLKLLVYAAFSYLCMRHYAIKPGWLQPQRQQLLIFENERVKLRVPAYTVV